MKKYIIPVCMFFLIAVGALGFIIYLSYEKVHYAENTMGHAVIAQTGGELLAGYEGRTTRVLGGNIGRLQKILTTSDRTRLFTRPEYDESSAITLTFSDGAVYIIAVDDSRDDSVFILYAFGRKNLRFRVEGYNVMSWALRAISPEGIYNENEIVGEDAPE